MGGFLNGEVVVFSFICCLWDGVFCVEGLVILNRGLEGVGVGVGLCFR